MLSEDETPTQLAEKIRAEIKEATGCTASVGIGCNVLLARMCTRVAKPDGCYHLVPSDDVNQFMGGCLLITFNWIEFSFKFPVSLVLVQRAMP